MKRFLLLFIFMIFLLTNPLYSQQIKVVRDFGVWAGFSVEKKIFNDFYLNLEQQVRTFNNSSKLDDYLFDAGLKYPINKHFILGGNIRYTHDVKRLKASENNFRYNLDIEYKKKINQKIKMRYRLRYQKELVNAYYHFFFQDRQQKINTSSIRNKIKLIFRYNTKHSIYTSVEVFRLIEVFREPYFNKFRFFVGNEVNNKIGEFDFSIGYEKELDTNYPYSFFFLKTIYKIEK